MSVLQHRSTEQPLLWARGFLLVTVLQQESRGSFMLKLRSRTLVGIVCSGERNALTPGSLWWASMLWGKECPDSREPMG